MKILFEEYTYKTGDVKGILGDFILSKLNLEKDTQQLRMVGYFYNAEIINHDETKGDLVFILPKVLIDDQGLAFGLKPEDLINFNWEDWKKEELVVEGGTLSRLNVYNFIYGFATWIYRAVDIYHKNQKRKPMKKNAESDQLEAEVMTSVQVGQSGKNKNATYMDILLSLLDFQRTHKNFITFVMKMAHSGFNKISWPKTIAKTTVIVQDDIPIYLNPINKKREINYDEELIIIYYSILNYMHEEYGFPIENQPGYKLITGAMFKSYMKSRGKLRLHQIRYKYYSDSAILLWNLCYAFFDKSDNLKTQANRKDYLLVNAFHYVFEAMIDELIGDKDLPDHLKTQDDDKRIDHLYTYKYLLEKIEEPNIEEMYRKIYNIADSKYYNRNTELRGHDVPKQFTYARNVIQWHMDLLHELLDEKTLKAAKEYTKIPLYDEMTEGYNVIPNFFISAKLDDNLSYEEDGLQPSTLKDGKSVYESYHFEDRLFDRSSLFTLHYDVNFLYILKKYAQNKSYDKAVWKIEARKKFRDQILVYLNETFDFYQILIEPEDIPDFVDRNFRQLNGKVFSFIYQEVRILLYSERNLNKKHLDNEGDSFDPENRNQYSYIDSKKLIIPSRRLQSEEVDVLKVSLGKDEYKTVFVRS